MTNRAQQVFQRLGPKAAGAVPALVDALEQGDESLRLQVLSVLQRLGSSAAEAAPALVRLVGNTDPNVRNYAMNVLSRFPRLPDEAAPALLEAIDRFDAQGQSMAVSLLGKFDPKVQGVVPVLVKLLDVASQPYTRQRALQSLRQLGFEGNTEAIDALVGALDHADASVRTQAVQEIRALRTISPKDLDRIVPALISVLTGPDRKAADQMARFLAEHGAKVVRAGVEALLPRIESEDPNERVQALERFKTLTEREPAEIRPARAVLLNRAEGPAQFERMLALRLLVQSGQVEGDRMRLILEKGLNDEDPSIRVEAADGLSILWGSAETPMPGLVPVLLKLADDAHPTYRVRAFEALERLGPEVEGSLPRLLAHRDDPDPDVRAQVAEGLLRMGHEGRLAAVPMIARGVVEVSGSWSWPDRWSRMFAKLQPSEAEALASLLVKRLDTQSSVLHRLVLALQELGPAAKPAVPALAALLGTASGFNTDQIVDVLAQLGPGAVEAGSERLVRRLDDPKPEVRVRAARLLLKLDPRPGGAGGRAIASMLDDPSTRTLAVTALGDLRQPVPEARPKLIEMLDDPDLSVRVQAARTLLLMGPEDASAAQRTLVPMLDDPRASSSRALIARTLAESGEEGMAAALPVLIEMLRSKDPRERSQAVQALDCPSIRGASEAVPALVEMLDEPGNHYVRGRAASALSYIGPEAKPALPDIARVFLTEPMVPGYSSFISALARFGPDGLPPLVDALADAEGYARRTIPLAIGRLGPSAEPAIPALVRIATGRDESETAEVRRALLQIGPRAVSALVKALDDDNPAARRRAALVLEEFGPSAKPAASALIAHLNDPDPDARIAAASALLMADRDADAPLPVLASGLSQGSPDAQETAARALSKARPLPEEYAEALEDAVADGAGLTRVFAAEALGLMSGEDHGRLDRAVSVLVRSMAEPPLQSATIDALEHLGPTAEAAIPSLADYLRSGTDTNDLIRAAYAIAAIGQADSVDVLDDLFDEIDPRFRPLLIEAIAQTGPQAPKALVQQLEHDDPAVRSMVVRHLGLKARGGAKVREPIVEALRDPAVEVRIAAVQALGHLDRRAKDLAPRLAGLLDEPDPTLRAEAAIALVRIEGRVSDVTRPVLVSSVTAASYLTRWRVMQALGGVGKDVLPTLIAGLKEGDYSRLVIAEALARIGPEAEAAIPALLSALERPNPPVRARAAVALVAVGGPLEPARAALLEALEAPELDPRLHGRFERVYPGGYTPTREYNKERSTSVWLSTTYPKVISRFVPVIDLVALRREMVEALGNLGEEAADALPVLSAIADDPSESETVRKAADEARRRIESTENGDE
jgi:HEAT repeat protein